MSEKLKNENLITYDDFLGVSRRVHYNQFIADFYDRFAGEREMPIRLSDTGEIVYGKDLNFVRRAERVRACSKTWTFDFYSNAKIKNLIRVDRCADRFCLNCQALVADQRLAQYSPILDEYTATNDLYHVVLTVSNVDDDHLADTITLMLDKFSYMIRFFDGRKSVRNVNFAKYGYIGAVRSLEITVSKRDGSYHPHLHCIFILEKDLDLPRVYWNRFSRDKTGRVEPRLFNELELLLQRVWCLLITKTKVTKENIENIGEVTGYPDGFSCTADFSNGDYHEIFKYAIKGTFKNETILSYEAFLTLYKALFGRRVYQAYGCLQNYDFESVDEDLGMNSPDVWFDLFITRLQMQELPQRIEELLTTALKLSYEDEFKYMSKATFLRHFKNLTEEEKREALEKISIAMKDEKDV